MRCEPHLTWRDRSQVILLPKSQSNLSGAPTRLAAGHCPCCGRGLLSQGLSWAKSAWPDWLLQKLKAHARDRPAALSGAGRPLLSPEGSHHEPFWWPSSQKCVLPSLDSGAGAWLTPRPRTLQPNPWSRGNLGSRAGSMAGRASPGMSPGQRDREVRPGHSSGQDSGEQILACL